MQSRQLEPMLIPAISLTNSLFLRLAAIGFYCWSVFSDCVLTCGILFCLCILIQSDTPTFKVLAERNLGFPGMV